MHFDDRRTRSMIHRVNSKFHSGDACSDYTKSNLAVDVILRHFGILLLETTTDDVWTSFRNSNSF